MTSGTDRRYAPTENRHAGISRDAYYRSQLIDRAGSQSRDVYRTQNNAALAPERLPQKQPKPQAKPRLVPAPRKQKGLNAKKTCRIILLASVLTVGACCLVARNAAIYENNRALTKLNQDIAKSELTYRYMENTLSADADLENYIQIGENELGMQYPDAQQLVRLDIQPQVIEPQNPLEPTVTTNWFDSLLDWLNGLERRE